MPSFSDSFHVYQLTVIHWLLLQHHVVPKPQIHLQAAAFTEPFLCSTGHSSLYPDAFECWEHNKMHESCDHGLKYKIGPLV